MFKICWSTKFDIFKTTDSGKSKAKRSCKNRRKQILLKDVQNVS